MDKKEEEERNMHTKMEMILSFALCAFELIVSVCGLWNPIALPLHAQFPIQMVDLWVHSVCHSFRIQAWPIFIERKTHHVGVHKGKY